MKAIPVRISQKLTDKLSFDIKSFTAISGGCVNFCGRLETTSGTFFIKWNSSDRYPEMFEKEMRGLQKLSETKTVNIPAVVMQESAGSDSFLLLDYLYKGEESEAAWEELGRNLANLHQNTAPSFGLETDNYIGSLYQRNSSKSSWSDFFREERLMPQIKLGLETGRIPGQTALKFETLYRKLPDLIPEGEKPALLHGDLWRGNVLISHNNVPYLLDPAIYYGHREAELAFTRLFGGFPEEFYKAYQDIFPLAENHVQRASLFNLYPLLVHVNLFGGSYLSQISVVLQRYL